MSMLTLVRDEIPAGAERVLELPGWVRPSAGGRYWHRPRSAYRHRGALVVDLWCGQYRRPADRDFVDEPPVELRCGTCEGRRSGFDGADGFVFRPRDAFSVPAQCPGTGWLPPDYRLCNACGERVQAARGWNAWGSATHRPGPGLAERWEPCPAHGWRHVRMAGDVLVCGRWDCHEDAS